MQAKQSSRAPAAEGSSGSLAAQPGWAELREAASELHAAQTLIGDPVADPRTALVHLRRFWRGVLAAARLSGHATASDLGAWAEAAELPGLGRAGTRRCLAQWRAWGSVGADQSEPLVRRGALRTHVKDARALFIALELVIGGKKLAARRRRLTIAAIVPLLLLAPAIVWVVVSDELPGKGPWRGEYHADRELEDEPVLRRDMDVDFDWDKSAPMDEIPPDKFSVRWDTCLELDEPAHLILQVRANDGARVFVDGETLIDAWERDAKTRRRGFGSGELDLEAGIHHLRVEMFEGLSTAGITLVGSLDGGVPKPLPLDRLHYPGDEIDESDPCAALR